MKIRIDKLVRDSKKELQVKDLSEILGLNISELKYNKYVEINEKQYSRLFYNTYGKINPYKN